MINLEELKTKLAHLRNEITFDEANHLYTKNGMILPSVTQIMKPLYDKVYGKANQNDSDNAKSDGKKVHSAIDFYNCYGVVEVEDELMPYVNSYIQFLKDKKLTVIASEIMLCHPVYNYAGTIDIVAIDKKEELTLIDIKTGVLQVKLHAIQDHAYTDMWESNKLPRIAHKCVVGLSDKGYKEEPYKIYDIQAKSRFDCCLKMHLMLKEF